MTTNDERRDRRPRRHRRAAVLAVAVLAVAVGGVIPAGAGVRRLDSPSEDNAKIFIKKDTTPNSPVVFHFQQCGPSGCFTSSDADDASSQYAGTWSYAQPGTYTVTELPVAGWKLVDIDCGSRPVNLATHSVTAKLDAGEILNCTFHNVPNSTKGSITVRKDASPDAPDPFSFTLCHLTPSVGGSRGRCPSATVSDPGPGPGGIPAPFGIESHAFTSLTPGVYRLTEVSIPAPWTLADIQCSSDATAWPVDVIDVAKHRILIHLGVAEHVTCVFTNTKPPEISSQPDVQVAPGPEISDDPGLPEPTTTTTVPLTRPTIPIRRLPLTTTTTLKVAR